MEERLDYLAKGQYFDIHVAMNWKKLRHASWLDTRARFVAQAPAGGSLLDLGSSDGETLRHMAELRPDLRFFAADLDGAPDKYPANCIFHRGDLRSERLPWADGSMSAITCMHLVEHLTDLGGLFQEISRLLEPGGKVYLETPHPKTVQLPRLREKGIDYFTLNFYDDLTHVKPVSVEDMVAKLPAGLRVVKSGISRNWLFAASHIYYCFQGPSRKKYTALVHWIGWSAYLIAEKIK